ncbi:MAG: biopolymer transporter ExbD [Gemmataceae bacterium]|nr:biopolymer transporter ExbD [Gemmataceae bacterium]
MSWKIRHEGSPKFLQGLTLAQVVEGLRDGQWAPTDEVMGPQDSTWVPIEDHPQLAEVASELEPPPPAPRDETHLDMNALIDVCLVLLIFFMLTTSYIVAVQKVIPLPTVAEGEKKGEGKGKKLSLDQARREMIWVQVRGDPEGKLTVRVENQTLPAVVSADGKSIDGDKLRAALVPYVRGESGRTAVLLQARDVSWGTVIAVQDAARAAGVREVNHWVKRD